MEVTDSGKHSGLLQQRKKYCGKNTQVSLRIIFKKINANPIEFKTKLKILKD
jgi:hypothetical protein